ncbi:MAG: DUF721 domain-containing protein [Chitinispirillales bacterium]|jgi:hypothetical protein|nr:DUF721 domain-containing protein [Chitinispirillales bacterium]
MLPKVEIKKRYSIAEYKISNRINAAIENLKTKKPKIEERIKKIYENAVGKEISEITSIVKYQNKELTVKVKNTVWKNELLFKEKEIKNLINSNENQFFIVDKIIFR